MEPIHLKMEKPRILTPKITYFSKFAWEDNDQTHTLRSASDCCCIYQNSPENSSDFSLIWRPKLILRSLYGHKMLQFILATQFNLYLQLPCYSGYGSLCSLVSTMILPGLKLLKGWWALLWSLFCLICSSSNFNKSCWYQIFFSSRCKSYTCRCYTNNF